MNIHFIPVCSKKPIISQWDNVTFGVLPADPPPQVLKSPSNHSLFTPSSTPAAANMPFGISEGFTNGPEEAPGPGDPKVAPGARLQILRRARQVQVVVELLEVGRPVPDEDGVEFENIDIGDIFTDQCVLNSRHSIVTEVGNDVHIRTPGKNLGHFGEYLLFTRGELSVWGSHHVADGMKSRQSKVFAVVQQ